MNLLNLFEDDNSQPGANYAEQLAYQIFKAAPELDATGAADEVLDYAFDLVVNDLGRKRAHSLFAYDEDFDGDLVTAYVDLQMNKSAEDRKQADHDRLATGTNEATDMMARERKKRLADAEKKKQERLAAEKAKKKDKQQDVAEGLAPDSDLAVMGVKILDALKQKCQEIDRDYPEMWDEFTSDEWIEDGNALQFIYDYIQTDAVNIDTFLDAWEDLPTDPFHIWPTEWHDGQWDSFIAPWRQYAHDVLKSRGVTPTPSGQVHEQGVAEGEVYDLEKEYGYEKPKTQPKRVSVPPTRPSLHPEDTDFMDPVERRLRADQERVKAAWAAHNAKKGVAEGSDELYQKAIRKYVQRVANDYLGGGNAHLYGAGKFDSEMFGVDPEQAQQDFKTLFPQYVKQLQGGEQGLAEGRVGEIAAEYEDYKKLSPREFYNMYKMTKQQWIEKYKGLVSGGSNVVQGADLKTVAKANLGQNKLNLPAGYGDVVQPQKLNDVEEGFGDVVKGVKRAIKGKPSKGERQAHYANKTVGAAQAMTPGMSDVEKEYIKQQVLKNANRYYKVKNLPKVTDEARVGNRMSDMSVGSPKIVYKNGRAVGEIGVDHDPSPGQGPYYMKHYETNTWYSGYDSKKAALADLKHVVDQMNEGVGADVAKLGGIAALGIAGGLAGNYADQQQPKVEIGGKMAFIEPSHANIPDSAMTLTGKDGKQYRVWSTRGTAQSQQRYHAVPVEGVKESEKNPFTKGSMGHALYRDLSKTKKASPAQQQRNRERFAKRDAEKAKQQGVAEADKKKEDDLGPEVRDVALQRAISRAKSDFPAAGSGLEALAKGFMRSQDEDKKSFDQLRQAERKQDQMLSQISKIDQEQEQEIQDLGQQNSTLASRLQQLQSVNTNLEKKLAAMSGRKAEKKSTAADTAPASVAAPATEPAKKSTKHKAKNKPAPQKSSMKSTAAQLAAPKADPMAAMTQRITKGDQSIADKVTGQKSLSFEPSDNVLEPTIPQRQVNPRFAAAKRDASDVDPRYYADIAKKVAGSPEQFKAAMSGVRENNEEEADYSDKYQDMVARVGQKAREQEKSKPVDIADLARRLAAIDASKKEK